MNEKNIILIAALGFGAYFLMTRKAAAARLPQSGTGAAKTQNSQPSASNTLIAGGIGLLSQWMGKQATQKQITTEQASEIAYYGGVNWDGSATNDPNQYSNVWQENAQNYSRGDN